MGEQVIIRIDGDQLRQVDRLVAAGTFPSRAAVLRAGLRLLVQDEARRATHRAYHRGYSRQPQSGDDLEWAQPAGLASLAEME